MAAKKKAAKKKAAKKKSSPKKTSRVKSARKKSPARKKKTAKKTVTKRKSSPQKKKAAKKKAVRKVPGRKSVSKAKSKKASRPKAKTRIRKPARPSEPRDVIIITEEIVEIRPPVSRDIPVAREVRNAIIDVRFELGVGRVTALLFRNGEQVGEDEVDQTDTIEFPDVRARDVITLNGVCSGSARIITNRTTLPVSDAEHPMRFNEQNILATLLVR